MHEHAGTASTRLSILERAAIEELDHTPVELSRLERLLIAAIVEIGHIGADNASPPAPALAEGLTSRERDVLRLIADGHTSKSAASVLHISPRTVEIHRLRIERKLGVRSAAELVRLVAEAGTPPWTGRGPTAPPS